MFPATVAIVISGIALSAVLGIALGLDLRATVTLAAIVMLGVLGLLVAAKSRSGEVEPARCPECEGLLSPNAPHCKHCGQVF